MDFLEVLEQFLFKKYYSVSWTTCTVMWFQPCELKLHQIRWRNWYSKKAEINTLFQCEFLF